MQQVEDLVTRLIDVTKYDKIIAQNWVDEEVTTDIYVKIANDYLESPDLRLTWLENLAVLHVQNGNVEEAVQCKIHIAYLVMQYFQRKHPKQLPVELRDSKSHLLSLLSPNLANELSLSEDAFVSHCNMLLLLNIHHMHSKMMRDS